MNANLQWQEPVPSDCFSFWSQHAPAANYYVMSGSPAEIIATYNRLTGPAPPMPRYLFAIPITLRRYTPTGGESKRSSSRPELIFSGSTPPNPSSPTRGSFPGAPSEREILVRRPSTAKAVTFTYQPDKALSATF